MLGLASTAIIAATEFVHPTGGIDDLLVAGKKRMAFCAHVNVEGFIQRGTRSEVVTATALYFDRVVLRVDIGSH